MPGAIFATTDGGSTWVAATGGLDRHDAGDAYARSRYDRVEERIAVRQRLVEG